MDIEKAFDRVNYEILLGQLDSYGIRRLALDWFKN